jgi:Ser/Thr protein kinase RdoA (MazF antagonist)
MEIPGEIQSLLTTQGWNSVEIIKSLESEKDANYLFSSNGKFFVAKIFHAGTHAIDIKLMVYAMKLARDRNIRVPCPGPIVRVIIGDTDHFMMVYELIPGVVLGEKLERGTLWGISVKVAAILGQLFVVRALE